MGKFAKYLPQFGWDPIVLTVDKIKTKPQTLLSEVDEAKIIRTPYFALSHFVLEKLRGNNNSFASSLQNIEHDSHQNGLFYKMITSLRFFYARPEIRFFIEEPWGWYFHAVKRVLEVLKTQKVDVIYSTYSTATSHLVASRLHNLTGVPWVAEFRDPWSFNQYAKKVQPFRFLEMQLEKQVIKGARYLVAISKLLAEQLREFHSKEVFVIPNGFDEEDYNQVVPLTSKFTITFTGNIYPGRRDPSALFKAVRDLYEERKVDEQNFEIGFFGENSDVLYQLINHYSVNHLVKIGGFVPYKESIIKQKESTILLLLTWNDPREWTYSGKVFEYLGARRPILASVYRGGAMDELINSTGCGAVANNAEEIKSILEKWINEWHEYKRIISFFEPKDEVIQGYTRKEQTNNLAKVLEKALL